MSEVFSHRCHSCEDGGVVCERHPKLPWDQGSVRDCRCGAPGIPCPDCCSPIPMDGTHSAELAFTPDWMRP